MSRIFNGERLKEARLYNQLTITELAKELGVSKQMVSKYENGKSEPSFEKSILLTPILDFPREFFYSEEPDKIENDGIFFRSYLTATQKSKKPAAIALKYSVIVRDFLEDYIDFPILKNRNHYDEFNTIDDIENIALQIRTDTGLDLNPIDDIVEVAELMGFTLISLAYSGDKVDAFSSMYSINSNEYFVIVTGNSGSFYRQQFSIAHEIGHWVLHQGIDPQELDRDEYKVMETQANIFASCFLLPAEKFGKELSLTVVDNIETYYKLKRKWNVSMAAMIIRAKDLGIISSEQQVKLYKQMNYRNWRNPEPFDLEKTVTKPVAFKQSLELLIDEGILQGHEFKNSIAHQYKLYLTDYMLAQICGVDKHIFSNNNESQVVLKLKDFRKNNIQ